MRGKRRTETLGSTTLTWWLSWVPKPTPKGVIVAIGRLKDCIPTEQSVPGTLEEHFGDFSFGRFAWRLVDVQPLGEPVPMTGHQGLWIIPAGHVAEVMRQLQKPVRFNSHF